jgi:hypothetical protein
MEVKPLPSDGGPAQAKVIVRHHEPEVRDETLLRRVYEIWALGLLRQYRRSPKTPDKDAAAK